jgi:hypothetical protein
MTPQAQRIAIAEASQGTIEFFEGVWYYWSGTSRIACKDSDPLQDLNAMHEAEKVLHGTEEQYYNDPTVNRRWKEYQYFLMQSYGASATAAHRAEAFLRTLNLWTDEQ